MKLYLIITKYDDAFFPVFFPSKEKAQAYLECDDEKLATYEPVNHSIYKIDTTKKQLDGESLYWIVDYVCETIEGEIDLNGEDEILQSILNRLK